jgi:crotonobetainyl-CoA:carnitine CoA-transferase CaiB-like acyl-CoA transferase
MHVPRQGRRFLHSWSRFGHRFDSRYPRSSLPALEQGVGSGEPGEEVACRFSGVTVIEVANVITGPYAGVLLADLGADVIKVEAPGGDQFRRWQAESDEIRSAFAAYNRGNCYVSGMGSLGPDRSRPTYDAVAQALRGLWSQLTDLSDPQPVGHRAFGDVFRTAPRSHWLEAMARHDVPGAPINRIDEALSHPQVEAIGIVERGDGVPPGLDSPGVLR